jgi:hypothetical protein
MSKEKMSKYEFECIVHGVKTMKPTTPISRFDLEKSAATGYKIPVETIDAEGRMYQGTLQLGNGNDNGNQRAITKKGWSGDYITTQGKEFMAASQSGWTQNDESIEFDIFDF